MCALVLLKKSRGEPSKQASLQYLKPRCLSELRARVHGTEQVRRRRRRLHIQDATSHMLQGDEVHVSALKEYVPCGRVRFMRIPPFFFFFNPILQHSNTVQQKAVWNIPSPRKNIQDDWACRLKMYMQMQATLEHAQVVNKLTRGRNNSV